MADLFLSLKDQYNDGLISKKERYKIYIKNKMEYINSLTGHEQNKAICDLLCERAKWLHCRYTKKNGKASKHLVIRWCDVPVELKERFLGYPSEIEAVYNLLKMYNFNCMFKTIYYRRDTIKFNKVIKEDYFEEAVIVNGGINKKKEQ